MASPDQTEELPELETAALEELSAEALAPVEAAVEPAPPPPAAATDDPFADLTAPAPPAEAPAMTLADAPGLSLADAPALSLADAPAPMLADMPAEASPPAEEPAAKPAAPATVSAKDLTDDILGGVDFDLPAPGAAPSSPKPMAAPTPIAAPKPIAPPAAAADGAKAGAPAFAFKPATPAFASGGMPKPASPFGGGTPSPSPGFGAKPAAPLQSKPAPQQGQVDPKSLFGDAGDLGSLGADDSPAAAAPAKSSAEALRQALTAETAPAHVPPEALRLAFNLCRVLVKKGVITADDLIS
jgi:hypothetical protein